MGSRSDTRWHTNIKPHVAVLVSNGVPVWTPTRTRSRPSTKRLDLGSSTQRLHRSRKCHERSVAFPIHNAATVRGAPILDHRPMSRKRLCPCHLTQLPHKTRRALHIREKKRHRSYRELGMHLTILAPLGSRGRSEGISRNGLGRVLLPPNEPVEPAQPRRRNRPEPEGYRRKGFRIELTAHISLSTPDPLPAERGG